jgi:hypothetical protein
MALLPYTACRTSMCCRCRCRRLCGVRPRGGLPAGPKHRRSSCGIRRRDGCICIHAPGGFDKAVPGVVDVLEDAVVGQVAVVVAAQRHRPAVEVLVHLEVVVGVQDIIVVIVIILDFDVIVRVGGTGPGDRMVSMRPFSWRARDRPRDRPRGRRSPPGGRLHLSRTVRSYAHDHRRPGRDYPAALTIGSGTSTVGALRRSRQRR